MGVCSVSLSLFFLSCEKQNATPSDQQIKSESLKQSPPINIIPDVSAFEGTIPLERRVISPP